MSIKMFGRVAGIGIENEVDLDALRVAHDGHVIAGCPAREGEPEDPVKVSLRRCPAISASMSAGDRVSRLRRLAPAQAFSRAQAYSRCFAKAYTLSGL
jgi:hypothetical protein